MAQQNQISKAVIARLPRYYRYLRVLIEQGVERVSSEELSRLMKATASQIRQDLNNFGGFGQQGYGYNVKSLYAEIGKILGVEQVHDLIVIGAGNLGRALVRYKGFSSHGFNFRAMFDLDESLCGKSINGVKIRHINELESFVSKQKVDIAALTIPSEDAIVKDVHLLDSLLELSFAVSRSKENKR